MRKIAIISLLFFSMVLVSQTIYPKRELRGAWISSIENVDWPSSSGLSTATQKAEMVTLLQKLNTDGINTIFFQVRPTCDALYINTLEPWSAFLSGTQGIAPSPLYDPLQFVISEGHKLGMEVHAWINPYRAVPNISTSSVSSNHVSVLHPTWCITYNQLKVLDPGKLVVRNYVTKVVMNLVRSYNIDGVHFDDYFYPYKQAGYTFNDAATFTAEPRGFPNTTTGLDNWRRDNVNTLVNQIHDSIKSVKNYVKFGVSPFGIYKNGVPSGITGMDAYSEIYCDPLQWLQNGNVDYLAPQLYWKIGGSQDYTLLLNWWGTQCANNNRHLYSGNNSYNIGSGTGMWGVNEIKNQINLNRANANTYGEIYFSNSSITNNNLHFADSLQLNTNKYKTLVPTMPWLDNVNPNPITALTYTLVAGKVKLTWNLPVAASDGDVAKKIVVYKFGPTEFVNINSAKNILYISPKDTLQFIDNVVLPASTQAYKFLVTTLDKLNNESAPVQLNICNGCDVIAPSTSITIANTKTYQTNNFSINFSDIDNILGSGIEKGYYLAANYNGTNWQANGNNGFAFDDFDSTGINPKWVNTAGTWTTQTNNLLQTDNINTNSIISAVVSQSMSNRYIYHWEGNIKGTGTNRRAGLHFMCSSNTQTNRGDSYLAWIRLDMNDVVIYKSTGNVLGTTPIATFSNVITTANTWYDIKVMYDRINGLMRVYINDALIGTYTDSSPINSGNYVSFRTGNTSYAINNFRVYRSRGTTANITVGAASTNDIVFQNSTPTTPSCLIKSITNDSASNISASINKYVNIDYTTPSSVTVNDGIGADVANTLNGTTIQANWTMSNDTHSGIQLYEYAIGTGFGLTDVLNYTAIGTNTSITNSSLSLVPGTTYYVSVKATNGAGLVSTSASSNGQIYSLTTGIDIYRHNEFPFTVFPNPVTSNLSITSILGNILEIELTDVSSKVVVKQQTNEQTTIINMSMIDSGIYFLRIKTDNSNYTTKIIKL